MKKIIYTLMILLLGVIACNDNSVNPIIEESIVTSFQGKFVNWTKGSNHRMLFLGANDVWNSDKIYSSSQIDSNGFFMMDNFAPPSSSFLRNKVYPVYIDGVTFQENTLICSDSTASVVHGVLIIVKDTSNSRVAEVYRQNFSYNFYIQKEHLKTGDFMTEYIYVDKNVTLNGRVEYVYYNPNFKIESKMTLNYDLIYKKGWNKRITYIASHNVANDGDKTTITAEYNYVNTEPTTANWHYLYY